MVAPVILKAFEPCLLWPRTSTDPTHDRYHFESSLSSLPIASFFHNQKSKLEYTAMEKLVAWVGNTCSTQGYYNFAV